jgi:DNA replication protein DnaC
MAKLSGLTEKERKLRLSQVATTGRAGTAAMLKACRSFVENPAGILTLWGGVGNGKTTCLQAVVNELIERGVTSVYITAFDLFSHIREAFNSKQEVVSESAYNRLMRFEKVRVLALDELDKVRPTDWTLEQLTDLIDKRHRRGLDGTNGTLIAMNTDPALQSDWIASRLMDGRNQVVHNTDADLRPMLKG